MDDEQIMALRGKDVRISWWEELLGTQSITGVFDGEDGEGYYCVDDFSMCVQINAPQLRIEEI